jgi:hypothetical protein
MCVYYSVKLQASKGYTQKQNLVLVRVTRPTFQNVSGCKFGYTRRRAHLQKVKLNVTRLNPFSLHTQILKRSV